MANERKIADNCRNKGAKAVNNVVALSIIWLSYVFGSIIMNEYKLN